MQHEWTEITGTEDYLYMSDVKARIAYLEDPDDTDPGDCAAELAALHTLVNDVGNYGERLVHEAHMSDFAQSQAQSVMGHGADLNAWPFSHIDWDAAADDLRHEMGDVTLFGETYYVD